MTYVTSITHHDVWQKIDVNYIESILINLGIDATIVFICTTDDWRKDDTWKKKGRMYYAIRLPYEQVKAMDDARPLMLEMVAQRLGIKIPETIESAARA
jgi:hypothetical protein